LNIQKGWIEKRQFDRIEAAVKVTYYAISRDELVHLLNRKEYLETQADQLPDLATKSSVIHAVTQDLSIGGMSLLGDQVFDVNTALIIHLHLPETPTPLTLIAEVLRVQPNSKSTGGVHKAGIKILAINRVDVISLEKYLLAEKLRNNKKK
jgi:hypothetical protein